MKRTNQQEVIRFTLKLIKFKKELSNSNINVALHNSLIGKINECINLML